MTGTADLAAVERWIRSVVGPIGPLAVAKERPWATVLRTEADGEPLWFKACRPVQAFEPRLSAELYQRWPDRVGVVLAHDPDRAWLLTADAGRSIGTFGNPPETWERALPRVAELQRGEITAAEDHVRHGVPDHRLATLPELYARLLESTLPLRSEEVLRLRQLEPRFAALCAELAAAYPVESVQHDDLHLNSLFVQGETLRVLDWGDASIGHPFFSLVVTFQFLEEHNGLSPGDPWFARLRDVYLEPWGRGLSGVFELAQRVGLVAHACTWLRHRTAISGAARVEFDAMFAPTLRRVLDRAFDG